MKKKKTINKKIIVKVDSFLEKEFKKIQKQPGIWEKREIPSFEEFVNNSILLGIKFLKGEII